MPAANVRTFEDNYTLRVEGSGGVYNSILVPAKKGLVSTPTLISSEDELLKLFTPNGTIEVGYNMAYYSALAALQKSDKLWFTRITNDDSTYGGVFVLEEESADIYEQVGETVAESAEITFNVSSIADLGVSVVVSDFQGGTLSDLTGKDIVIDGVGTHTVVGVDVAANTADITGDPIANTLDFAGTGFGSIDESADFATFSVNFGVENTTTSEVTITGMSAGGPDDLDGVSVYIFPDAGSEATELVVLTQKLTDNPDGDIFTLGAPVAVTSRVSTGYAGNPAVEFSMEAIASTQTSLVINNIIPTYVTTASLDSLTASLSTYMNDGSVSLFSDVLTVTEAGVASTGAWTIPALPTSASGLVAAILPVATGIADITAIDQTTATGSSALALTSADQGDWSKDIRIEILTGKEVREPDAFIIKVFNKGNLNTPLETFEVTRIPGQKNGYGRNMFVESSLESSKYIRGFSNSLVADTVLPMETVSRDINGNVVTRSFISMIAGDDGSAVTDSNMIQGMDLMSNKNSYPCSVFMDGGWTTPAYQVKIAQVCEARDDSVALLSVPYDIEVGADYANQIVSYRDNDLNLNSSYAALYSSHVKITDKYNDRTIFVAPDGYAAAAINYSASNYEIWYPPAGYRRGRLFVEDVLVKFTDAELDLLQDAEINPLRFAPGKGIAIWGQVTLSQAPSVLDRLNVRLLLNEIKPGVVKYLEGYLFELNTTTIRNLIKAQIDGYLRSVEARNGISGFYTVCNDTNNSTYDVDNNILNVDMYVKPMHSIEYINLTTILTSSGIEFSSLN